MEGLKIFNLNVRVGNEIPANDRNALDKKSQCAGNNKRGICTIASLRRSFMSASNRNQIWQV